MTSPKTMCPVCGKVVTITGWNSKGDEGTIGFDCGHSLTQRITKFSPKAPPAPTLHFAGYDGFAAKIQSLGNKDLTDYHSTTRYRIDIADYCLKLLLGNYDNGIAFSAGLTGFLVQAKATLDSLCEEINLYYNLNIATTKGRAVDVEKLLSNTHILSRRDRKFGNFLTQELGPGSTWFKDFKDFRDQEGTHRKRSPRNLIFGKTHEIEIQVGGKKVEIGTYCVDLIQRINRLLEDSYRYMT